MSSSLLLSLFFQYPVLLTLVLLLLDHHKEKEERRGRDVLDGARRLVRGAAPTVRGRVRAAVRAAGRAAGPDAPARWGAQGPRRLVAAAGRPVRRTLQRVGPCRVADGRGGGAAGVVGALCFALGASSAPPTVAGAPAQFAGAVERVSLTVSEQRARQALRVEADPQKLEALRAKAGLHALGEVSSRSSSGLRSCGGVRR